MTQQRLAELSGCARDAISRYVNGSRLPRIDILYRMSKVLDKNMEDFLYDIEDV